MTILQSIVLGIVQGVTEFLPISSSAHLVIIPYLFGWQIPANDAFVFDVLLHLATLTSLILFFASDLAAILKAVIAGIFSRTPFTDTSARLGWYILLAAFPVGFLGLLFRDSVKSAFSNPQLTALLLILTSLLMVIAERVGKRSRSLESLGWKDALWIGFFQMLSIFPGISRSGSTISGGMTRNLERPAAARFSFLLSVPLMLGAGALGGLDLLKLPNQGRSLTMFLPGILAAALVGYLSIRWLLSFISRRPFYLFALYCSAMGIFVLAYSFFH